MRDEDRKPIEYRQLCAIVKTLLQQEPSIDDSEWKARTRDTLAKYGFQEPDTDAMARAMSQVEYALRKTIGPRPARTIPVPTTGTYTPPEPTDPTTRTRRPAGWDIVLSLMAKLAASKGSGVSAPSSSKPPAPREFLAISEEEALREFWAASGDHGTDRLALLKAFAEIAIVRLAGWDFLAVRAEANEHSLRADGCFACRNDDRSYHWHHVVQIQHGGSNYVRNRVPLCGPCHRSVHPWMPGTTAERRTAGSWFQVAGISTELLERIKRRA